MVNTGPKALSHPFWSLAKFLTMGAVGPSGHVFWPPPARMHEARPWPSVMEKSLRRPMSAFRKPEPELRFVHCLKIGSCVRCGS